MRNALLNAQSFTTNGDPGGRCSAPILFSASKSYSPRASFYGGCCQIVSSWVAESLLGVGGGPGASRRRGGRGGCGWAVYPCIAIHRPILRYLPPPCILKYMDTGYRCIADTTVLQYLLKGCIHTCIHGYIGTHATPGRAVCFWICVCRLQRRTPRMSQGAPLKSADTDRSR